MFTGAVRRVASAAVEIAADLAGNVGPATVPGASRGCPCLLSWPSGIKKRAVCGGVLCREAAVAPSPRSGLSRTSEGFGV